MDKNLVFFGTPGITSTSANYVANLAKEYIKSTENSISGLIFYTTKVKLLSTDNVTVLSEGDSSDNLELIDSKLSQIAEVKSLIAWLREAIKAKTELLNNIKELSLESWAKQNNIVLEDSPRLSEYTEDDAIAELSVKDRNNYFRLQTYATVYGQEVHPDGTLSNIVEDFRKKLKNPAVMIGSGRDGVIYYYIPTIEGKELDDYLFKLQTKQRNYQAMFNGIAYELSTKVFKENNKRRTKFTADFEQYKLSHKELITQYTEYKESEGKRIADLKIIIPNELKPIFDFINSLGK